MDSVLILGAGSDIGIAIARKFAGEGYGLQLAARDTAAIHGLCADTQIRFGVPCSLHHFEAADAYSHQAFFASLDPKPTIAVYSIGYMGRAADEMVQWEEDEKIISSNYTGAVSILNIIAAYCVSQKKGIIIGISSVAGDRGRQSNFVYGSAKAAFSSYLSGLRNRLYPSGVHVVTVKPGFVYTKMTEGLELPPLLTASPEMVANAVYHAAKHKKNIVYVKGLWRWIMLLIKLIPEPLFKRTKI